MAAPYKGNFILSYSNNWMLQGSTSNDLLITVTNSNQSIGIGNSNTSNMYIRINSNGYVGIGKSNPAFALDINGDINFGGTLRQGGTPYVGSQWSNNSSNVFIMASNIGIGTLTPNYKLDVVGDVNFTGTLRQGGAPYVGSQWSNTTSNVYLLGSNVGICTSAPSEAFHVARSNAKFDCNLYVMSNMSIGKSNPSAMLDVVGNAIVGSNLSLSNSSGITTIASSGANIGLGTLTPLESLTLVGSNFAISNASGKAVITSSNGNLGINNSNPQTTLDVVGTTSFRGPIQMNNAVAIKGLTIYKRDGTMANITTSSVTGFSNDTTGNVLSVASNNNSYSFRFFGNNVEIGRFTGDGMLAIGSTAPNSILYLASNASTNVYITMCNTQTGGRPSTLGLSNTGEVVITSASNYGIIMQTSNVERMRITSNGFVGINQTNPAYQLDVNGSINCASNVILGSVSANTSGFISANNLGLFRNRIINGDMRIDQRNVGNAFTSVANTSAYTVDRWAIYSSPGTVTIQRVSISGATAHPIFQHAMKVTCATVGNVTTNDNILIHVIEGYNIADMNWGTSSAAAATLSFWMYASFTGTMSVAFRNVGGARSYVSTITVATANTWGYYTITVPGDTAGTWNKDNTHGVFISFNLGEQSSLSTNSLNTWMGVNYVASTSQFNFVGTVGNTFYLTGVQFEKGTIATPFEFRPYATELSLCQRYCYVLGNTSPPPYQYPVFGTGYWQNSTFAWLPIYTPVPMRLPSSSSVTLTNAGSLAITYNGGIYTGVTLSKNTHAQNIFTIGVSKSGGAASANQLAVLYDNTTTPSAVIVIDNEL